MNEYQPHADIVNRTVEANYEGETEKRRVELVHYTTWPDFDVPKTESFACLLQHVNRCNDDDAPIVVHCSAGVGRTGTFCLIDSMLKDTTFTTKSQVMERAKDFKVGFTLHY